jgi:hypothetical protein
MGLDKLRFASRDRLPSSQSMLSVGRLVRRTYAPEAFHSNLGIVCVPSYVFGTTFLDNGGPSIQCPGESEVVGRFFQSRRNVHDVGFDTNMLSTKYG